MKKRQWKGPRGRGLGDINHLMCKGASHSEFSNLKIGSFGFSFQIGTGAGEDKREGNPAELHQCRGAHM
jgi:hypothetical protein